MAAAIVDGIKANVAMHELEDIYTLTHGQTNCYKDDIDKGMAVQVAMTFLEAIKEEN